MMELLQRFEGSNAEETDSEGEDEEEDALVQSLKGVDLGMEPTSSASFFSLTFCCCQTPCLRITYGIYYRKKSGQNLSR